MSVERAVGVSQSTVELAGAAPAAPAAAANGPLASNGQPGTNGHLASASPPGTNGHLASASPPGKNGRRTSTGLPGTNGARLAAVSDLASTDPSAELIDDAEPIEEIEPTEDSEPIQAAEPDADDVDDAARRGTADAWDLVRRTQEGDADAFGLLYDRYVDTVYRFVYYRLGDRTQAEDLTSETFLRALRRISTVHEQGRDIGAWLVTIARNLVLDHVKSAQYRLCVPTEEIVEAHLEQAGDTTEAAALAGLDQRALLEAVKLLSPEQQESIVLRFFQGLSLAETAEVMGRNAGAVKALQHRAMQRLHILLTTPTPASPVNDANQPLKRDLPRHRAARAPPAAADPTSVRKRYRTRPRRNH